MYENTNARNSRYRKNRVHKPQTNKLLDKITYNPKKHKQKVIRKLRKELKNKFIENSTKNKQCSTSLKFGSHNINALDLEEFWAVQELLKTRGFDVRFSVQF